MLRLCVFSLMVAVVVGNACVMSEWGAWSKWSSPGCTVELETSMPLGPSTARMDRGGMVRQTLMKQKDKLHDAMVRQKNSRAYHEVKHSKEFIECTNGFAGPYRCSNVDQVAFFDFEDLCGEDCGQPITHMSSSDSWGWTDPLDGTEYAIHLMNSGSSFVRLYSDYSRPKVLAFMLGSGVNFRNWRDAKVIGNFVYIGSESYEHGMQIFDLTRLRDMTEYSVVEPDRMYMGFGNSHNIVASPMSNTIFAVGCREAQEPGYIPCSGGLHAIDVSDPLEPKFAGCFDADGYTHDAQCVEYIGPDSRYSGRELCFNFNEDTLTIVDVTDKSSMTMISRTGYTNSQYTHQGWLTEDQSVLLMDDEVDEYYGVTEQEKKQRTHIWDVSNLEAPVMRKSYLSSLTSIDHNQYIVGDTVYQANYEEGLRILHFDQPNLALSEIAYFDMDLPESKASFRGIWNAYPYFTSNQVVCSVIESGLFILKPDLEAMRSLVQSGQVVKERHRKRFVMSTIDINECPDNEELVHVPQENSCA